MEVGIETAPRAEDIQAIRDGLRAFNGQHTGPDDYEALVVFARDEARQLRAGLLGETFWRWLHIGTLWVDEPFRRQGVGGHVLRIAEEEAIRRGCTGAFVDTLSFQAPAFYAKHGYSVWGQIEGLPPGHRRIFFQKRLSAGDLP